MVLAYYATSIEDTLISECALTLTACEGKFHISLILTRSLYSLRINDADSHTNLVAHLNGKRVN